MKNELLDRLDTELSFLSSLSRKEVQELFDEVNNYVKTNFLGDGETDKYYLKYNGAFYQVGYYYGPEVLYYVRIVKPNEEIYSYIEYEKMKNNEITEEEKEVKGLFDDIHSDVERLRERGVSRKLLNKAFKYWGLK